MDVLTPREREIALLVIQGLPVKTIACRLWLSDRTVASHLTRIHRKLHVHNAVQLAVLAIKQGWATTAELLPPATKKAEG